jgi:predicted ABC-type sugar transport system permease subunit
MSHKSTETQIEERVYKFDPALASQLRGRRVENTLAYIGAGIAVFTGVLEALSHYGFIGTCQVTGFPWFNIVALIVCVAPKTLGRATVGKYLDRLPIIGGKNG